jgi:hypothetical protein
MIEWLAAHQALDPVVVLLLLVASWGLVRSAPQRRPRTMTAREPRTTWPFWLALASVVALLALLVLRIGHSPG